MITEKRIKDIGEITVGFFMWALIFIQICVTTYGVNSFYDQFEYKDIGWTEFTRITVELFTDAGLLIIYLKAILNYFTEEKK